MSTLRRTLRVLVPLALLSYLGFYVYGIILGVFSPAELLGFTILAIGFTVGLVAYALRLRRSPPEPADPSSAQARAERALRERRGF